MFNSENGLSIVIPVYKSEKILSELYNRLTKVLSSLTDGYEIIFVNDCSPDNSWQILSNLADSDPHVNAILLRKNSGYDNALMAGMRFVGKSYVVIMDDDLQHNPSDISILFKEIKKGYDVVYAKFLRKRQSFIKNFGSWFNDKLAEKIINKPAGLYLSPFKILKKEIVNEIVNYDGPFPYIDGLIFQITSSISQIPIEHHKRAEGKGNHGIRRSLGILFNFCTTFSILLLRVSTILGIVISFIACIFSIGLLTWKIIYGINIEGWTSIILGIMLMGGFQLMGLGIVGEYVGRTYMNINRKPQYVIKEIVGNKELLSNVAHQKIRRRTDFLQYY